MGKVPPVGPCAPCASPSSVCSPCAGHGGPEVRAAQRHRGSSALHQPQSSPRPGGGGTGLCPSASRSPPVRSRAQHRPHTPERRAGGLGRGGGCMRPPPTRPWTGLLWDPSPVILLTRLPGAPGESPRPAGGSEAPLSPWQSPRFASCRPGPPGEGRRAPVPLQRRAWAGEARPLQQRRRHRGPAAGVLAV